MWHFVGEHCCLQYMLVNLTHWPFNSAKNESLNQIQRKKFFGIRSCTFLARRCCGLLPPLPYHRIWSQRPSVRQKADYFYICTLTGLVSAGFHSDVTCWSKNVVAMPIKVPLDAGHRAGALNATHRPASPMAAPHTSTVMHTHTHTPQHTHSHIYSEHSSYTSSFPKPTIIFI